ncbi:LON peptidase substrate-binding domain-containing protein [Bosea minatitlanensis]|uniref:LON peptidase substrate-binding domain-containing protein n=1 Tax=Bosea minatitlanensis TaxID=128782 RepID=A0ABW0F462_9HYPH|nr:LON peptidase substrate-binding domain-containing protein [Bosea minatitlanensis]MCT4493533.1 LON peptidase substrate-binding domain-containing protein [Bosea minatitlanensis]
MSMNAVYKGAGDCPQVIPLFPLTGALLLPRGQMPLNIFEPRYLAMIDDAIRGDRVIGMIQPVPDDGRSPEIPPLLKVGCLGRITQFAETGDDRYIVTLTGISRFRVAEELSVATPYRQARVDYAPFARDFVARAGEEEVDRDGLLRALRDFAKVNDLKIDWKGVNEAPNEALVNALAMMCPFGPREKQALLEAESLRERAAVLVAITEIELARGGGDPDTTLQ